VPLPPRYKGVTAAHFQTREEAFRANLIALRHRPGAVEMMDRIILDLTRNNREQQENREFVRGDPGAILIIEFARDNFQQLQDAHRALVDDLKAAGYGYHYPLILGEDTEKVWNLRKSGLGVLSNLQGDARPVSIVEDTAVNVADLPQYMADFQKILDHYRLECVYHAHIGSGELHLRPILNLKDPEHVKLFRTIGREIARLVKKYNGSLSGEHGDGRVRGEFIPLILGEKNYQMLRGIKSTWDPLNIFNPGKITDAPPVNENLRYEPGKATRQISTVFDFSDVGGILRAAEKCNGSGDCRKTEKAGGTMCPSYMATRNENDVTRARANILREFLTHSPKDNPFDHREIYEVMDLCLSCKACKRECPSNVDVAKLKAEFLQHYYDAHGIPLRTRLIANITRLNKLGSLWPGLFNFFMKNTLLSGMINRLAGFAPQRSMPLLNPITLNRWMKAYIANLSGTSPSARKVYLFNDEFTNYNDTNIGIKTIQLLTRLGYQVTIPRHLESGRTYLSKGLLRKARRIANRNIESLQALVGRQTPLIGVEPSAILTFRDEYPELAYEDNRQAARKVANNSLTIEEFLQQEMQQGRVRKEQFSMQERRILLHGHCQQKAVASTDPSFYILSFPENHHVEEIPSGCCGMAGSFGYEKEHYDVAMKVGELVLFPAVRRAAAETIIAAPGTSCRHQISDGTGRKAVHPVEVLYQALL
jgi:Fe-S oxidoreductase